MLTGVCLEALRLRGLRGGSTLDGANVLSGVLVATGLRALRGVSAAFVLALATAAAAALALAHAWSYRASTLVATVELFDIKPVPAKLIGSVY